MTPLTERDLYAPLLAKLARLRRVRDDSLIAEELPLYGRRVDLAILTSSGSLFSVELKLRDLRGVLAQARLNLESFDRSYIAVGTEPARGWLSQAATHGIGVFVVNGSVRLASEPTRNSAHHVARQQVVEKVKRQGRKWSDVRTTL